MEYVFGFIAVCVVWALIVSFLNRVRRKELMAKYGDEVIVNKIMNKMFWQGQTPEQLIDSIGRPLDTDQRVMKTKVKEVWKYNRTGKGRYALRITLENGVVVGWDSK
ncbi:DUF2845 domain-containing protein [Pseudomonas oryzihabitans]|uniref:DUF2845 domain-containing protein n=1 Tax=Pseudomonas oryzihabitans TaxID=47885 RepID=UPI0011A1904F|nr:DUF2845 domain-containing protein [Pseudomonas psychrotolerans]